MRTSSARPVASARRACSAVRDLGIGSVVPVQRRQIEEVPAPPFERGLEPLAQVVAAAFQNPEPIDEKFLRSMVSITKAAATATAVVTLVITIAAPLGVPARPTQRSNRLSVPVFDAVLGQFESPSPLLPWSTDSGLGGAREPDHAAV